MKQRLLPAVVLLLACVSTGSLLAGSLHAEEAAQPPGLGYTQQEQQAAEWGQSPWLDAYAPPPQDTSQAVAAAPPAPAPPAPPAAASEHSTPLQYVQLTEAEAEVILQHAAAAAAEAGQWDEEDADDDEAAVQPPYVVYLDSFSAATASQEALGSDTDAAAMQFVGVSSPADLQAMQQHTPAPPYIMQSATAPAPLAAAAEVGYAPPPPPVARAPAPGSGGYAPPPVPSATAYVAAAAAEAQQPALVMSEQQLDQAAAGASVEAQLPGLGDASLAELLSDARQLQPQLAAAVRVQLQRVQVQADEQQEQQLEQLAAAQPAQLQQAQASIMGSGQGKGHAKGGALPTDPSVPPLVDLGAMLFCDPQLGMEPSDDGRCACMPGFGTNLDMQTCARCPVGWYSRGGAVGMAYCKPCPQLATSNPARTACVQKSNVIRPNVPASLCEPCVNPAKPFMPPDCCGKGQVCCGTFGCCTTKRCINNATTGNVPYCCGDDCNIGQSLNCCPGGSICVNTSGSATSQLCCPPANVCGDTSSKSCCGTGQTCCNNKDCCNTVAGSNPRQQCTTNNITGAPTINDLRCCLTTQINCNGTCCTTLDSPPSQRCYLSRNLANCCDALRLCTSDDGTTECCSSSQVCQRNVSSSGATLRKCCPPGFQVCPKNAFPAICCPPNKCPSAATADNCLP